MNGSHLRELRLYRQMTIGEALSLCATATESAAQWAIIESTDAKVPAAIEKSWGLIKLPRSVKSFTTTPAA